ncbi:MAG: DNA mismatch repair endonuclease MutL [Bacillota bacterium]
MPEIKQLSEEVANQISAGEVVERPASVVKELVENSIDANASRILIEIKNGGKDLIRVKDNGSGIEEKNIEKAFSRYATSKIDKISDLYSLNTLGFRGEALASISSVSKLTAISKTKNEVNGTKIVYNGGKKEKKEIIACAKGTDIKVEDLFYNTPARFKYLKTTNTEFGHISKIITQEALAHPEIKFNLKHNGKDVLSTPGNGKLSEAIYSLYGKEIFDNLNYLEFEENYIKIKGYISNPSLNRSSRIHEMFFVNKRAVSSRTLSSGVEAAYRGLIAKNKYPIVFLFVDLNPILVDVNVHPAKKEVKFSRNNVIKSVIKKGIKNKLNNINPAVQYKIKNKTKNSNKNNKISENKNIKMDFNNNKNISTNSNKYLNKNRSIVKEEKKDISENNKEISISKNTNKSKNKNEKNYSSENKNLCNDNFKINKIFGQVFNSYILVETNNNLYIIDQHNAHERILFDKFYKKYKNNKTLSQKLLTPVNLELTPTEIELIDQNQDIIEKLGFEIEKFGGKSILIQAVPELIADTSIKNKFREIIDNIINETKVKNNVELIEEIIEYMACRSAIKVDRILTNEEIERIVNKLFKSSNPFRCPHGRPILFKMSREEIDKGVGR